MTSIAGLVEAVLGVAEIREVLGECAELEHQTEGGGGVAVAGEAAGGGDEPGHGS